MWWAVRTTYRNLGELHKGPEWVALQGLKDEADALQRQVDGMVRRAEREVSDANAQALRSISQNLEQNVRPEAWREAARSVAERSAAAAAAVDAPMPEELREAHEASAREMFAAAASPMSDEEALEAVRRLREHGGGLFPEDEEELVRGARK